MVFFGVIGQGGESASASELGAAHQHRGRGGVGYKQLGGVSVAHL